MIFLCVIIAWHAYVSIIDELFLWDTFDGFVTSTLSEYQIYLNRTNNLLETTYYFDTDRNQTMVKRSNITTGQRSDRYALFAFGAIYVVSHIVFFIYMYFWVYKRRRIMKIKDREYLVKILLSISF